MSELKLPDKDDLLKLPRWARAAFAARCARRVLPLLTHSNLDEKYKQAVVEAVEVAENSAIAPATRAAIDAVDVIDANAHEIAVDSFNHDDGLWVPRSAYAAVKAAADASADVAAKAAQYACEAASQFAYAAAACLAMRVDYRLLLASAKKEGWNDNTPVAPEFFGPMWPNGAPEDWPEQEETSESYVLEMEFDLPDNTPEDEVEKHLTEIVLRINRLHRAYGGHGLIISNIEDVEKSAQVLDEVEA